MAKVRKTRKAKFVKQAVFFAPKAFTEAQGRAWIKKQGETVSKGKRIERMKFTDKKTGKTRGVWFGWPLRPLKKGTRIRWQAFGKSIMVRWMISGPKPKSPSNPSAKRNASIQRTTAGFRVVHSTNRLPLSGTFTGSGARARAMKRAKEIIDRNFRSCALGSRAKKCTPMVNRARKANRNINEVKVAERSIGFVLVDQIGRRIPGFVPYRSKSAAEATARIVRAEMRAGRNPFIGGLPTMRSLRRRAQFLADGTQATEIPVDRVKIRSTTIPLNDLIFIGNLRQLNYSAPKFDGKWREFRHRPEGFPRVGSKLKSKDGGLMFLHPDGDWILVVPTKNQRGRFTMDQRGILN